MSDRRWNKMKNSRLSRHMKFVLTAAVGLTITASALAQEFPRYPQATLDAAVRTGTLPADASDRIGKYLLMYTVQETPVKKEEFCSPVAYATWKSVVGAILVAIGNWLIESDKASSIVYGGGGNSNNNRPFDYLTSITGVKATKGENLESYAGRAADEVIKRHRERFRSMGLIGNNGQSIIKTDNQDAFRKVLIAGCRFSATDAAEIKLLSRSGNVYDPDGNGGCTDIWKWLRERHPRLPLISQGANASTVLDSYRNMGIVQKTDMSWNFALGASLSANFPIDIPISAGLTAAIGNGSSL